MGLLTGTNVALPQFSAILAKFTNNDWKTDVLNLITVDMLLVSTVFYKIIITFYMWLVYI